MQEQTRNEINEKLRKEVGALARSIRESKGLTLNQVGQRLAVIKLERVKKIEEGKDGIYGRDLLELSEAYEVPPEEFNRLIFEKVTKIKSEVESHTPKI